MASAEVQKRAPPTSNIIRISAATPVPTYKFLAKVFLMHFEKQAAEERFIELHALGEATMSCVRVVENLERQGVAIIKQIRMETAESNLPDGRTVLRSKMVIKLVKGARFDIVTKGLEERLN